MSRIVIVGSGGRMGAALLREWRREGDEVIGFDRRALDLGDETALRETLSRIAFDALVNCAAVTQVDYCESHAGEADRVNAQAVGIIAEICSEKRARCIHISTDYVFDGETAVPYTESDVPRPLSIYGASKLRGEELLHAAGGSSLAVRVSWVFGPDRASFVDQILNHALDEDRVAAISDKIAVPTFTLDAASWLRRLVNDPAIAGVLHLCNAGACSWQEYGQHALDCAVAVGVPLRARSVAPLRLAEMTGFVAARPRFSAMSTKKLSGFLDCEPRAWQDAVEDYVRRFWAPAHR